MPLVIRVGRTKLRPAALGRTLFLALITFICLFPLLWILSTSLKPLKEIWHIPLTVFPHRLTLENYFKTFQRMDTLGTFIYYYRNTIIVTFVTVASIVFLSGLSGYTFARLSFPGKKALFGLLIAPIFIPGLINLIVQYEILRAFRLTDNMVGLILLYVGGGVIGNTFIMRAVFMGIPGEFEDAAKIDGCSHFSTFTRIMLPQAKNGAVYVAVTNFVGYWTEYLVANTMTMSTKARTMGPGVLDLRGQWEYWDYGIASTITVLTAIPTIVIFLLFQRHFVAGLSEGALKL